MNGSTRQRAVRSAHGGCAWGVGHRVSRLATLSCLARRQGLKVGEVIQEFSIAGNCTLVYTQVRLVTLKGGDIWMSGLLGGLGVMVGRLT